MILDRLADESGLAIVVVDENSSAVSASNNNSMCRALYSSEEFAPRCNEFCGKAFEWASESETPVEYECYAGLKCSAVKLESAEKPLVAIVGRTFLKAENYRKATERAISGDWQEFPPSRFFENVLLSGSDKKIEKLVKKVANLSEKENRAIVVLDEKNPIEIPVGKTNVKAEDTLQLDDLINQFKEIKIVPARIEVSEIKSDDQAGRIKNLAFVFRFASGVEISSCAGFDSGFCFDALRFFVARVVRAKEQSSRSDFDVRRFAKRAVSDQSSG